MSVNLDPFEAFNRVVLAICEEEDREATAEVMDFRFPPIPLTREARRDERRARFEFVASSVFQAAIVGGIPREEAEAKVNAVAEALTQLMAVPWWQRLNIGDASDKEASANALAECLRLVHKSRQAVFRLSLTLKANPQSCQLPAPTAGEARQQIKDSDTTSYLKRLEQRKIQRADADEKAKRKATDDQYLRPIWDAFQQPPPANPGLDEFMATSSQLCDLVEALLRADYGDRLDELPAGHDEDRAFAIGCYRRAKDRRNIASIADDLRAVQEKGPTVFGNLQHWFFRGVMEEIIGKKGAEPVQVEEDPGEPIEDGASSVQFAAAGQGERADFKCDRGGSALRDNAVERLYQFGKTILQSASSARKQQEDQWIAAEEQLTDLVASCYSELVPKVISFSDLQAVLRPVEEAGRNLLTWERNAPHTTEERRAYFKQRFLAFANCLDYGLTELRWTANGVVAVQHGTPIPPARQFENAAADVTPTPATARQAEGGDTDTSKVDALQTRAQVVSRLRPATRKAYLAFQWAESKAGKNLQDRVAYDLVKEEGIPENAGNAGELTDYKLPDFPTWTKHLRNARAALGEQKYTPRRGRATGKSIVRADEVERQKLHDE